MHPSENLVSEMHPKTVSTLAATGRKLRTLAASVAVVLSGGFIFVHHVRASHEDNVAQLARETATTPALVEAVTVQKSPASVSLTLPGTTAAWYESVIYARVNGYVGKWNVDIGDHVVKDQVLATLETPELDAELVAAKAKLKSSQALVEFTKSTYKRWKESPAGVVSDQERESTKADYDRAIAQVGIEQANVDRYTVFTAFKQVTAPYDGTITERHIDIGNLVTAGSTVNTTPLYRIVKDDPIRVFVDVPQSTAHDIAPGLVVHITANDVRDRIFNGKVARTANAINKQTRTLRVEADISNPDHALVSGMYINASFEIPIVSSVQVPAAALVFRSNGPQIAVVDKESKVDFRNVSIARDNGNNVDISSGVNEGEKVALNISNQIVQGDTVSVHDRTEDGDTHARN